MVDVDRPVAHFIQDIKAAEGEMHILTPTRYPATKASKKLAGERNKKLTYDRSVPVICERERKDMHRVQIEALRMLGRVRLGK
jgi:hypothetical protein